MKICVFKVVDKTVLSMDKSVDKFFSSNVLESSSLVIDDDEMDNLFYPFEEKIYFHELTCPIKSFFPSFG